MDENSALLSQILDEVSKGGIEHITVGDRVLAEYAAIEWAIPTTMKNPRPRTVYDLYGVPCHYDKEVETYTCRREYES